MFKNISNNINVDVLYDMFRICIITILVLLPFQLFAQNHTLVTIGTTFSTDKVYTITSGSAYQLYVNGSSVSSTKVSSSTTPNTTSAYQFAFVQDPENASDYYLYNVGTKEYLRLNGTSTTLGVGTGSATHIYVYTPGNSNFPDCKYVLAFNGSISNWNSNAGNSNNTYHVFQCSNTVSVNDWTTIGGGGNNSFNISEVPDVTFSSTDISEAQRRLKALTDFSSKSFADAGIIVNTKIYTIRTGDANRGGFYTTNSGLTSTKKANVTYSNDDANQQFVFVTDPDDNTKVYLWSVGQGKFVAGGAQTRGTQTLSNDSKGQIYVSNTNDYDYTLAFAFTSSANWHAGGNNNNSGSANININENGVVVNNYSAFDAGNRFQATEVGDFSAAQLATARAAMKGWLTGPFHYRGASGNDFKSNGMQDVAEVNYYYFVDPHRRQYGTKTNPDRAAIDLMLPFKRYLARSFNSDHTVLYTSTKDNYSGSADHDHASNGNNYEPRGYIRWYNYNNDRKMSSSRLIPWQLSDNNYESNVDGQKLYGGNSNTQRLHDIYDQNGNALGLVATPYPNDGGNSNNNAAAVGVAYIIPSQSEYESWKGDTIACDVSFYTDFNVPMKADGTIDGDYSSYSQNLSDFRHEPTLSTRYVFHILPAKVIADNLYTAVTTPVRGHTSTYADRGVFSFGALSDDATMALRIPLPDVPNFYFWPLNNSDQHHVYHKHGDDYGITKNDFTVSGDPVEAAFIEYRVYTADSTMWRSIRTDRQKMVNISVKSLNGSDWKYLNGDPVEAGKMPTINRGGTCFLVGYAVSEDKKQKCPFFNARLDISNNSPLSVDTLKNGNYPDRLNEYLESHFGSPIAQFTFDSENKGLNLLPPTGNYKKDEVSNIPYDFSKRDYSFLYLRDLIGFKDDGTPQTKAGARFRNLNYNDGSYVLHGDYELVKQMNIGDGNSGYDMLHEREPSQYGYFMYTDASDESRSLGSQDFQGSLCSGSQIIVSAWVRNGSGAKYVDNNSSNNVNAAPELRFTLLGVTKDQMNHDISTKEFAALCTGDFDTNIKGFEYTKGGHVQENTKDWYQVFGTITLPANSGIENYSDFRIVIDNFCNTADGADYAIDDIFVYQSNSKVEVIQDPALCNDTQAAKDAVKIKIRGNYSSARQLTGAETGTKKVYYRFCKPDVSNRGIPVTGKDFYGEKMDTCGVTYIPQNQVEGATLAPEDGEGPQFEENAAGVNEVILVNKSFNLSPDSTYYVSLALPQDDGTPGNWGLPSSLCSFYSSYFNLVRQQIYFNGTATQSKQFLIPCGSDESNQYTGVKVAITAPSHISTGSVTLTGLPFHWYTGSNREYKAVKDDSGNYLSDAVRAYATKFPGQPYKAENATDANDYTAAYKALIEKNLYSADKNPEGKLYMSAADSLSTIPLKLGRDTITAVVAEDTAVVNKIKYTLCPDPMEIYLQVSQSGPGLAFGMTDVMYPSSETVRSIRIGLPQLKRMKAHNGTLTIPVREVSYEGTAHGDETLKFLGYKDDNTECDSIYISYTNDPSINLDSVKDTYFGRLKSKELAGGASSLDMYVANYDMIHEGYEYVLMFKFKSTNYPKDASTQCVGETYLRLRIVPEYVTWNPTADNGLNSNWNNDANWIRSTAGDLYRADYTDYRKPTYQFQLHNKSGQVVKTMMNQLVDTSLPDSTIQPSSYVPMYFTKVTIPTMASQRYPMLGYIAHQASNGLVQNLVNYKQHVATANIRYDMMANPSNADSTSYNCVVFDGNLCEQIHFKTGAQLRNEQYLKYDRAWTELALPLNVWGTFTTPMEHSIAGDMYVPKVTAMQTTPLFEDIYFTDVDAVDSIGRPYTGNGTMYGLYGKAGDTMYNRVRMPVYQKLWGEMSSMRSDNEKDYSAYDNPYQLLIFPEPNDPDMSMHPGVNANNYNAWSHTFNFMANQDVYNQKWSHAVNGIYDDAYGLAGKIGDSYSLPSKDVNPGQIAIMRLPKADTSFRYYQTNSNGSVSPGTETVDVTKLRDKNYRLGVQYTPDDENGLGEVTLTTASLQPQAKLAFVYREYDAEGFPNYVKNSVGNIVFATTQDNADYGIERQKDGSIAAADTTSQANGLVYDLVGNPYTSAISVKEFINGNQNIFRKVERNGEWVYRIWSLVGDKLYEYNDSSVNTVIQPGQSIFIRIQRPGIDVVHFTTRMQTDPNITEGVVAAKANVVAPAKVYTINDNSDMTNIIDHGVDTNVYCWSPYAGVIAVSGETIRRVELFSVSGQLVASGDMSGSEKQFTVGDGIYIVKATLKDGKTESRKVAVK